MIWRFWSLLCGIPVGVLAVLAASPEPPLAALAGGAVAGGLLLLGVASLAARRAHSAERERRLAGAASAGLLAVPALLAQWVELAPGPRVWLALVLAAIALGVVRATRAPVGGRAPRGILGLGFRALAGGAFLVLLLGLVVAALRSEDPPPSERRTSYVYDVDARVATRPLPRCDGDIAGFEVLSDAGAHPRLGPEARMLWFDAQGPQGRRQIHRLDRQTGEVLCWTCAEPGNNRHPAAHPAGHGVVFDTDRHANWRHPTRTELHLVGARGDEPPRASQRLTSSSGQDDHAIFGPGAAVLVWSRGQRGRYDLVSAALQSGHGGTVLGTPNVLVAGGVGWIVPLGWSPNARALAVGRGHPLRPLTASTIDFATGREMALGEDVAPAASVAFSADGDWMAVATTRPGGPLARMPRSLGFVVARVARALDLDGGSLQGAGVRTGATGATHAALELGELAGWGAATGIALEPDASGFVLGQRRREGGFAERLVQVRLSCETGRES